ncbi:hypothetical protein [Amycolatopsis magusensis]|uniref:hypothetical protein n=1 Tax=Amycolatopsis magusensis TaxID=882444 RepID=UPI0024A7CCCF|nr:hypothetical protein [Amycolatopsis magusensis]MDI5977669.1 hypothetical protein [Amycolatopsis magusensis]
MSSAQVPLWVPILVGLLGVAGVVTAQVITTLREERRWRREQQREDLRWERQREERTHEARAEAYAELIGVLEALDMITFRARQAAKFNKKELTSDEKLAEELRTVTSEAQRALGPVNLHAPERIRVRLQEAVLPRMSLAAKLLRNEGDDAEKWTKGQREYRLLRAEMRRDLGLDAEDLSHLEEKAE